MNSADCNNTSIWNQVFKYYVGSISHSNHYSVYEIFKQKEFLKDKWIMKNEIYRKLGKTENITLRYVDSSYYCMWVY